MAKLIPSNVWQSTAVSYGEIWEAEDGSALLSSDAGADKAAIHLHKGKSIAFSKAMTVYYRKLDKEPTVITRFGE